MNIWNEDFERKKKEVEEERKGRRSGDFETVSSSQERETGFFNARKTP